MAASTLRQEPSSSPDPSGPEATNPTTRRERGHRPEIEGLRTVAVLLVAVYHIWFGKVSGGVDVFLVLTGFLITGSLVRTVERDGRVAFLAFWARLARRLLPAAAVVLGGVLIGTFLLLPRSRWTGTLTDVVASALYLGNWRFAREAVDYLARDDAASPVQHFWSLAVQGQFYLLWPFLITAAALVAARCGWAARRGALVATAVVFAVSLTYSVLITGSDPQWAYFDAAARGWELALGALLALLPDRIRPPRALRVGMGWFGLLALTFCGLLVPVTASYPGYVALWPTGAAALIILAGGTRGGFTADRILTWPPLVAFGGFAYALFLWHWPVLVFYLEVTQQDRPSLVGGCYVLGASLVLAVATRWLVQGGAERLARAREGVPWSFATGALFLVPVLVGTVLGGHHLEKRQQLREELSGDPESYPGAAVALDPELAARLPELPPYPDTTVAAEMSIAETGDCTARLSDSHVVMCEFGPETASYTIALVGSSHARHWFPALREIAVGNGWRLITLTKNGCHFTSATQFHDGEVFTACAEWNDNVLAELARIRPDAIFTPATKTVPGVGQEHVVSGFPERWRQMEELGIDVVAVRDTPRLDFDAPECVDRAGPAVCVVEQNYSMAEDSPLEGLTSVPGNVHFLDITPYLCPEERCPVVIGNMLVYYDTDHFTAPFARSMAAVLEPRLREVAGGAVPPRASW